MRTLRRSWIDSWQQRGRWIRMAGGGPAPPAPTSRSGGNCCASCWPVIGGRSARVRAPPDRCGVRRLAVTHGRLCALDEFAAQEMTRCAIVQLYVVERISEDLGRPDQSGLDILDLE